MHVREFTDEDSIYILLTLMLSTLAQVQCILIPCRTIVCECIEYMYCYIFDPESVEPGFFLIQFLILSLMFVIFLQILLVRPSKSYPSK